ncbi:MAG: carboxypeptidase-like regulatory domain-containing protein [Bacteroidetes bacterium]|nr:carboxypeptidase-like regulatory domain-containing protein [Bacteroidota bacterium]
MVRNLLFTFVFVLTSSLLVFSQTGSGTLKGRITDKATKEAIPFANIVVEFGGVQVGGSTSDFDGNFLIKPIPPGKVDMKATCISYRGFIMKAISIPPDKITFQNIEMEATTTTLKEVEVVQYKVPLISADQTTSGGTVTSEEISKMANRSADAVATTVGGVQTDANGNITSLRGQRSSGTVYYIDGMRVIGSNSLPQSAIEQVEVILGGTPASYGDATGGIISVTTKGPSKEFSAGIDIQTSQYIDRFGYNRLGLNFTGPLISRKDTLGYKTPILGYFVAGDLIYQQDGNPYAFKLYKVKDDVLAKIKENPIRVGANGQGVYLNADYLHKSDLEQTNHTLNSSFIDANVSGKFDIRVSPTINMSFGGTYHYNYNNLWNYYSSMMNSNYNGIANSNTWRVNGRFTQRFPTGSDSKSFVKNVFYSINADYSRSYSENMDADHKADVFKYGYIGSFATHTIRAYTPTLSFDTVAHKYAHLQNGYRDTAVVYNPSTLNPESANWVSEYYRLFNKTGFYETIDEIIQNGGLINGMQPESVYGLWASPGTIYNGYGYSEASQVSVNANFAADLGNHEIQFGLQYQQRSSSAWSVQDPVSLWSTMRGLTNSQLRDLDLAHPQLQYSTDGVFMDTINYFRRYSQVLQRNFDISLREKLGLPVNGTDWIDLFSYDFKNNSINYYDQNQVLHTLKRSDPLFSLDMFNADELLNNGSELVYYYGYGYTGKALNHKPSVEDFFNKQDAKGNYTHEIAPFSPIYMAGYIQDKFAFKDLIFNIGLRVDRYDANQSVLKDPYLFFEAQTASEVKTINGVTVNHPAGIGDNYVVYVDDASHPNAITGYRNGNQWYNKEGSPVSDPRVIDPNGVKPYLTPDQPATIGANVFKDYVPQINYMPRISFSFPISDDALFYAHYDILTQRPTTGNRIDLISYYFINVTGSSGTINNPNLQPEKTIDYELGFQQKINNASSMKLTVFYREMRDQIQQFRLSGAYPKTYYSYANIDFGTVKGLTVTYDLRRTSNARIRFNYTLQFADGTGSDANAAATIVRSDQPNLRTMNPLNFDRRHSFAVSLDYRYGSGKDYNGPVIKREKKNKPPVQFLSNLGANLTLTGGSGMPYTKSSKILNLGGMGPILGSINGARLPWQFLLNLRVDKDFNFSLPGKNKKQATLNVYVEILNLLNTTNVTGVYPATGSPKDDGYLSAPEYQSQISQQIDSQSYRDYYSIFIDKPYNYSTPRQTRLGLMFNF